MRLLQYDDQNNISLTHDFADHERPQYAILSHTWAVNNSDEVTHSEVETIPGQQKIGFSKIKFCATQAKKDGYRYFWVDACCIDRANHTELSEALTSMFRWYREAQKCYVYLSDVSVPSDPTRDGRPASDSGWKADFQKSRWFKRGWTLQELLAPVKVEFFSEQGTFLGDKSSLAVDIHTTTSIPAEALRATPISDFPVEERMKWAEGRQTKNPEDRAYSLFGIFGVSVPIIYGEGEQKAFERLKRAIQEQSGHFTHSSHTHWIVPRAANSMFTGRQDLLQEMEEIIRDALYCPWYRPQCRIVISGIGGQGKSELCLQLAQRLRYLFWAVLWVDVSTTDIAERSFRDMASKLSITATDWQDACYGISNLQHPWLLILDNADDPEIDYQDYLPDSKFGIILMTTRNDECHQYATSKKFELPDLGLEDAKELLVKAARIPFSQRNSAMTDAATVASLLQSHALALVQAGAYIARGHCTLADYPLVYERQRERLLTFRPKQAHSRYGDVYATFEVSAQMLHDTGTTASRDALHLLPILAVCTANRLPLWLFESAWHGAKTIPADRDENAQDDSTYILTPWHINRLPSLIDVGASSWDDFRLIEAVSLLKAFSLISIQVQERSSYVTTHPLVHAWARDRQTIQDQEHGWLQTGCLLAFNIGRSHSARQIRELQPQVAALTQCFPNNAFVTQPRDMVARILVRCAWHLHWQLANKQAANTVNLISRGLELSEFQVHSSYIGPYRLKAVTMQRARKFKEAVELLERVYEMQCRKRSKTHPSRLVAQHQLANAYLDNDQIGDAIKLLEDIIEVDSQILAETSSNRLDSMLLLAESYGKNGQIKEAIELFERVTKLEANVLADDHPSRITSQQLLASAYVTNGQYKEAIELLEHVSEVDARTLDIDDPARRQAQRALASAYVANGEVAKGIELLKSLVELENELLDENDISKAASQTSLAAAYHVNEQFAEEIPILEAVVKLRTLTLSEGDPDRMKSQYNLASAYESSGNYKQAVVVIEDLVRVEAKLFPADNLDRLRSQKLLANCLWHIDEQEKAVQIMIEVVRNYRSYDANSPYRLRAERCLEYFRREQKKASSSPLLLRKPKL